MPQNEDRSGFAHSENADQLWVDRLGLVGELRVQVNKILVVAWLHLGGKFDDMGHGCLEWAHVLCSVWGPEAELNVESSRSMRKSEQFN